MKKPILAILAVSLVILLAVPALAAPIPSETRLGAKLVFDRWRLALTGLPEARAELLARIAQENADLAAELSTADAPELAARLGQLAAARLAEAEQQISQAAARGRDVSKAVMALEQAATRARTRLAELLAMAPEPARAGLQNALERANQGIERALTIMEQIRNGELRGNHQMIEAILRERLGVPAQAGGDSQRQGNQPTEPDQPAQQDQGQGQGKKGS
ncbi:MAG: hypothetical protein AB1331_06120 [Bacillota bacterium]